MKLLCAVSLALLEIDGLLYRSPCACPPASSFFWKKFSSANYCGTK